MNSLFKLIAVWLLAALLAACSLTRNREMQEQTATSSRKWSKQEQSTQLLQLKKSLALTDSAATNFSLLIKPIGPFHYSERNGFNGHAEYLLLKGQATQQWKTAFSENFLEANKTDKRAKGQQSEKTTQKQRQLASKSSIAKWWYLIPLFLAVGVIYRLVKRKLKTEA